MENTGGSEEIRGETGTNNDSGHEPASKLTETTRQSGGPIWCWIAATLLGGILLRVLGFMTLRGAIFCGESWFEDIIHRTRTLSILLTDFPENTLQWGSPAYPYFCALIGRFFGHETTSVFLVQLGMGLLTALLLAWALRPVLSRRACWIAALIYSINPMGLFFEMRLVPVALTSLLLVLIMRLVFWRIRPSSGAAALGGVLIGLGILLKPWLFIMISLAGLWVLLKQARATLAAILFLVLILPLPIGFGYYNSTLEEGKFELSGSDSYSFYHSVTGDTWGTARSITPPVWHDKSIADGIAHEALGRQLNEFEVSSFFRQAATDRVLENPINFVGRVMRKVTLLLSGHEVPDPVSPGFVFKTAAPWLSWGLHLFPLLLAVGLLGLTEIEKRKQLNIILPPVIALTLVNLLGVYSCSSRWPLILVWLPAVAIGFEGIRKLNPFSGKPRYLLPAVLVILIGSMLDLPGAQSQFENRSEDLRYESARAIKSYDNRRASRLMREAVKADPTNAMAQVDLAKRLIDEDLYLAANKAYETALELDPDNQHALYELGDLLLRDKEYVRAESLAVCLIALHPNHPLYLNQLGVIQMMQRNYSDAKASFNRALEILPEYQVAIINLREVEKSLRTTVSLAFPDEYTPQPNTPLGSFSEAVRVAQGQQDKTEAERLTREGLTQFPDHPFPIFLRGTYFISAGNFQEAASFLTRVTRMVPGRFVLTQSAAQALFETGDRTGARNLIQDNLEQAAGDANKQSLQRLLDYLDNTILGGEDR